MARNANVTGGRAHAHFERGADAYFSPPEAAWGLVGAEGKHLPQMLWEPACGDGALVKPLRETGRKVRATDLHDYGCPRSEAGIDFLRLCETFDGGIVTNPPYKDASSFIRQGLFLAPYVAVLLRLQFLEGIERSNEFRQWPLARVYVFSRRLPMMHRYGWTGPKATSTTAFAWFVFDLRRPHDRKIGWITDGTLEAGRALCEPNLP